MQIAIEKTDREDGSSRDRIHLGLDCSCNGSCGAALIDGFVVSLAEIIPGVIPVRHQGARAGKYLRESIGGLRSIAIDRSSEGGEGVGKRGIDKRSILVVHRAPITAGD